MIPPRLLSLSPLPSRSTGAFRRFYSVCFRATPDGRKSVGPIAVSPPVPTIAPNEGRKEGVDEEIMTNVEGGEEATAADESTSVAKQSV